MLIKKHGNHTRFNFFIKKDFRLVKMFDFYPKFDLLFSYFSLSKKT